jgi:peptidoglycan/LPS O-acetylase OafA/YrhL
MHNNCFDFVRILAASSVLLSHHFALSGLPEPVVLKYQTLGGFGVLIFFALSGYLVAQSWVADPHILRFVKRRLLRIWPGLIATVLICGLIIGPLVTTETVDAYFKNANTWKFFSQIFFNFHPFLSGVFSTNAIPYAPNGVLWTIRLELACYLTLIFIGVLGVFKLRFGVLFIWIALCLWYFFAFGVEARVDSGKARIYFLEYMCFFYSGVLFFTLKQLGLLSRFKFFILTSALVMGVISILLSHQLLAALFLVPTAIVFLGESKLPVLRRFGRFGDFSYGIYIYAFPIQQLLVWGFPKLNFWLSLTSAAILTLIASFLSWHLLEKQVLKLKPKATSKTAS